MSPAMTLILRAVQAEPGQSCAELAESVRISKKHARKMLAQLKKAGKVDWARRNNQTRWYLPADAEAIKREVKEDRRVQKLCYLIDWRAKQRESMPIPLSKPAASVFQLGAQ